MLKERLNNLIKFICPACESGETLNPDRVFQKYYAAIANLGGVQEETVLQELYNNCQDIYKGEEQRRLNIAQKAIISLSATGISSAIIVGLASLILNDKLRIDGITSILTLVAYAGALIYFLGSIIAALRVLGKSKRNCIGPDDLPPESRNKGQYLLHLSKKCLEYTIENYKLNNIQLSIVYFSQECFRNAVILLIMCGLLIGSRGFSAKVSGGKEDFKKVAEIAFYIDYQKQANKDSCFCHSTFIPAREKYMGLGFNYNRLFFQDIPHCFGAK